MIYCYVERSEASDSKSHPEPVEGSHTFCARLDEILHFVQDDTKGRILRFAQDDSRSLFLLIIVE